MSCRMSGMMLNEWSGVEWKSGVEEWSGVEWSGV